MITSVNTTRAEEKGDSSEMVTSGQFDSVCGVHSNYREMVFFTHKSVRADYIILYKQDTWLEHVGNGDTSLRVARNTAQETPEAAPA